MDSSLADSQQRLCLVVLSYCKNVDAVTVEFIMCFEGLFMYGLI